MQYEISFNGKTILPAQACKLCKIATMFSTNVRREATITDKMQILLSYARAFEEDIDVRFFGMRLLVIVEDTMSHLHFEFQLQNDDYTLP